MKTLLAFILLFTPAYADLVAHYALDETSPSPIVTDSLGQNPGTLIGTATPTKGFTAPHATAYDFPLRSGFKINPSPEVQPSDQFTLTWWFRPTTLNAFDRFFETLSGTGNDGSGIRIDLGGNGTQVRALLRDGNGSSNTTVSSPLTLSNGSWYFFALRYDSRDGTCKLTVLQDTGNSIATNNITSATTTNSSLGTNAIVHNTGVFIAADEANAAGSNDFGGAIDDIAIFQTGDQFGVLSDAQLAQVYNLGALAFDPPAPRPTITSFTANNPTPNSGDPVTLTWNTTNADSVEISPAVGTVATNGSHTFTANFTEVYTLTATNPEGSTTSSLQITVDGQALLPRLSEFVADNSSLDDGDGNSTDWIEIHNRNTTPFDLSGYHLTDDPANLTKWPLPATTTLAGDQYLLVFASGTNTPDSAGHLHTNFSLSANGEYLALTSPTGAIIQEFSPTYPPQKTDVSYTSSGYLSPSTPRSQNLGNPQLGFVKDTTFSTDRGHYDTPFTLTITTATPDAEIYYTIDGTAPSPSNGTLYSNSTPLNIATTTILRAAAFKANFLPTNIDTQSYLFLNDVVTQPNNPPNTTTTWAGKIADYEMDPDIVTDPAYSDEIIPALKKFSSLSLTIAPDDFYGPQGLYQNPQSSGPTWERPVSAELIAHDGSETGFQIDAGLRIQGGSSRNPDTPKHSLSLRFRNDYGAGKLNYPLFKNSPDGRDAVENFDTLQLRSGYNFGWTHRHFWQANKAQYARDQFVNDLFLEMDNPGVHGRWLHLYINGIYWGLYHIHERPDQDFMEAYFGGQDDDYDAINSGQATYGTIAAFNAMTDIAEGNIASSTVYETMKSHLDIDSFIDYMLINFFVGNNDWDGHNWRAAGTGPTGVPFHVIPWDTEFAISPARTATAPINGALNINRTGLNGNNRPTGIHQDLTKNAEYRLRFADRAHSAFFNNGPLAPGMSEVIWRRRSNDMELALVAESARWGDYRRDVQAAGGWQSSDFELYTRNEHYYPIQTYILGTYLQQRPAISLDQLRARNLYPGVDAPQYNHLLSTLSIVNPNSNGTIYYTTDGTDPRDPSAQIYTEPIDLTASATYNSRVLQNGEWSALQTTDILTGTAANFQNLVISELYYNEPGATEENEFIEFTNISDLEINLSNLTFTAGLTYTFPVATTLAPGAQLILTPADYSGSLDNSGETITLIDTQGFTVESFSYNDKSPWPEAPDGEGFSLVRISPTSQLDPNDPASWRTSTTPGGNPGSLDSSTYPGGDLIAYALQNRPLIPTQNGVQVPHNLAADDLIQQVQTSTNLVTWNDFTSPTSETLPQSGFTQQSYQITPTTQRRFYRVKITLR
ncbi:MAG: hypothetical protein ACJAQT_001421 [Akkermansiaceae bacterium]|jgi:hypothetical protein